MGIQVTRTGTNWTVDVTALQLVQDTSEKDFIVVINNAEQPLAFYAKTGATVVTYNGVALPANTVVTFYRWGLRDVDLLEYGEITSQLGMNRRLTQIERVLDDLREVKQFIWGFTDGSTAIANHVAQTDPHNQYRLKSAVIPEIATAITLHETAIDPHPTYTTAAELTAALTGYLPTTQKGAINGLAPLDGSSKVPAVNSRGCNASYVGSTGVWTFTWADGATQTIDTPLETVFQSVNYSTTTKVVTFTLVGGATTSFSLADLVDLPEVQVATVDPVSAPTTGQRLYYRSDNGNKWISNGTAWVGPYLALTAAERTKLGNLTKSDVGLGNVDNTSDANKPVSSATATALAGRQPLDSNLTAIANLPTTPTGLIKKTGGGTAVLLATGAVGEQSMAAVTQSEGRAAIEAETWRYPGSTLVASLTGVGLEQRLSDRSVWLNDRIVQSSQLSPRQLNDRQTGYIRNGACNFPAVLDSSGVLRAENWPGVIAYPQKTPSGDYMLLVTGAYNFLNTECAEYAYIPAGIGVEFVCNVAAKTFVAGNQYFPYISQYDADKLPVDLYNATITLSTASTLAAPLAVGATTVRINKGTATQWGNGYLRHLLVFPYKNSFGGIYPKPSDPDSLYCYSRYNAFLGTTASVSTTATEYVLTLPSPWAHANPDTASGGVWPAGTEVAESQGGDGNTLYPYGAYLNYTANQINEHRGVQIGLKSTQKAGIFKLAAGTQFVRIGICANYGANGNETLYQMDLYPR